MRLAPGTWLMALAVSHMPPAICHAQLDPRGSWRTLQTAHFNVHARAEHSSLARIAAAEAESAYAALSGRLRAPRGRIELVVADNVDFSNGFAGLYPVPRVVVYALPPPGDIQLGSYDRWLRLVITHELAHVFHLDRSRGWWRLGRSVFGRAPFLFPNLYTPPWVREGVAVFYESDVTGAGRLAGSFHRAVVGAGPMPLSEASIASAEWPAGIRAYSHGGTFMRVTAARAGDSAIASFVSRASGVVVPWIQLSGAFAGATGRRIGPAWREWQAGVRAPPGRAGVRYDGLRLAVAPRLSPDGRRLLLVHNDGRDATRLITIDVATGEKREWARLNGEAVAAWESDTSVIVAQPDYVDLYNARSDLWRVRCRVPGAGCREERLTTAARLLSFDVSREGEIVAVRAVPGGTELVMVRLSPTPATRQLAPAVAGVDWAQPRLAADGRIVVTRVSGGRHDIVLLDRGGRVIGEITSDSVRDMSPAFSADGRAVYWTRDVDGVSQIVSWREGEGIRLVSREPLGAFAPLPVRDSVFYLAYEAGGFALAAASAAPVAAINERRAPSPSVSIAVDTASVTRPYSPLGALLPRYWLPLAFSATRGAWLGAISSGTDPLERHAWAASLEVGTGFYAGQWRATAGWTHAGPGTARLDASLSRYRTAFVDTTRVLRCCLRDDFATAGVTLTNRRWRRSLTVRLGAMYEADGSLERAGGVVGAAWSSAISPALAVSSQDGARLVTQLRARKRLDAPLASADLSFRVSAYRSFGRGELFARPVAGARFAAGTVVGNDPLSYSVGGESGGSVALVPGLPALGTVRGYPVRGYAPGFLVGRHVAALSLEQRVPLALVGRNLGLMPIGLEHLFAAAFADFGAGWARQFCPTLTSARCSKGIASVGAELGTMLMMGYDFPLLVRVGAGVRLKHSTGIGAYATVGSAF